MRFSTRSLYLKVFLAIWLVMMVVVGCNMLVTWMIGRQFEESNARNQQLSTYAVEALQSYQQGGPVGLNQWRRELYEQTDLRVLLLDNQARNLTGEPLPRHLRDKIYRFGNRYNDKYDKRRRDDHDDDDDDHSHDHRFRPLILPLQSQDQSYLFVVLNPYQLLDHLFSGSRLAWRLGLTVLLVALLSFLMARYLIRPIRQLQHTSRKLADGELDSRVGDEVISRRDELGHLGQDFDRMAERIQSLVQGQQQLLRDVSHELRTPLARQRVALELARKQLGEDASLDRIEQQAEQLDQLIDEILMLARLDADLEPKLELTDLNQLLSELADEFNLDQPRITFSPDDPIHLSVEPRLIRRAVANTLSNALKYSQQQVELRIEQNPQQVTITIADHGPGIEEEMLEQIFEPFVRTDKARSRQQGGWGLGLAIAARAVRRHQGQISARNRDSGGLELQIKLPR